MLCGDAGRGVRRRDQQERTCPLEHWHRRRRAKRSGQRCVHDDDSFYQNGRPRVWNGKLIVSLELAQAFIKFSTGKGKSPFRVAWYKSDTTYTIQNLETGAVDVGITYNIAAEEIAIKQGIAKDPAYYAFRDHFLLVGPKSNPANIDGSLNITDIFSQLHEAAEDPANNGTVRFLSRYDKSATNIKESELWARIGQVRHIIIGRSFYSSVILS